MTDIEIPRRTGERRILERVAAYRDPDAVDAATGQGAPWPPELADAAAIPVEAARELGLRHGQTLRVTQREVSHLDDGRIARRALQEGVASDPAGNYVDAMDLLQAVIDATVTASNFGIHPGSPEGKRVRIADMDAPRFAWWLYRWLGASDVLARLTEGASNSPLRSGRSPSPGATRGTPSSSTA